MKRRTIDELVAALNQHYVPARMKRHSSTGASIGDANNGGAPITADQSVGQRRRMRRSALDQYRPVVEAFVVRRARAENPSRFTYQRLSRLIERRAGRRFAVSTLTRRLAIWGLADAMRRYSNEP